VEQPTGSTLPYVIDPGADDQELVALIESWRYRGEPTPWDAVVGHAHQVRRCQELAEALSRDPAELAALRLQVGRGVVIAGPAGTGKTLLARALATAIGREVIVPPTAELTPALIARLYAQLGRIEPVVVIIDEAEGIIGHAYHADSDLTRAFCVALDGIERPDRGPVTLALTTASALELSPTATRAGRLAPRLQLEVPTLPERRILLERAIESLPIDGELDLGLVVERTAGWTGADLVVAVQEACMRSLPEHVDALRQDYLLAVVGEKYVITDERPRRRDRLEAAARHEAGHAIYGHLVFPGQVAMVQLDPDQSTTRLTEAVVEAPPTVEVLRRRAGLALAGLAAEMVVGGRDGVTDGASMDRAEATSLLLSLASVTAAVDTGTFEAGQSSDRGSERMRAAIHADVEARAAVVLTDVIQTLTPHAKAIEVLAETILEAPEQTLSGEALLNAIERSLAAGDPLH
jgi:SpoVK/Ycf46/Vps4 family AAA+-type ATPase